MNATNRTTTHYRKMANTLQRMGNKVRRDGRTRTFTVHVNGDNTIYVMVISNGRSNIYTLTHIEADETVAFTNWLSAAEFWDEYMNR